MNIKGLKLTKEFIRKLYSQEEEIHDVKECIEPFVEFQWKGFDNDEFFHLINSYLVLLTRGMNGTYIYCCDKNLCNYLKNRFSISISKKVLTHNFIAHVNM